MQEIIIALENEVIKTKAISELIALFADNANSGTNDMNTSYNSALWLLGNIASDNAQKIDSLVQQLSA